MQIESTIDSIYQLKNVLANVGRQDAQDIAVLAYSGLWMEEVSNIGKQKCYEIIVELIAQSEQIGLEDKWTLYSEIIRAAFLCPFIENARKGLRKAYFSICSEAEKLLVKANISIPQISNISDRQVVLITDQFLGIGHSPTKQILDYAYAIQHNLGYKALIINSGTCWLNADSFIPLTCQKNYVDEYNDINSITYLDETFGFHQCEHNSANIDVLASMFCGIKTINPYCVIGVGDSNILTDLCRHFAKTAVIPCDISVPVTMAEYALIPMKLEQCEEEAGEVLMSWQKPIETVFNFVAPDKSEEKYNREDYGIPEDAFVTTVVGNRLDLECTEEFWKTCNEILESVDNSYIVVIGNVDNRDGIMSAFTRSERLIFAGAVNSSERFMEIVDLLIQPTRKGGGRSTVDALRNGVPVVITKYGDSYYNAGPDFAVDDYEEMAGTVCKYAANSEYYEEMSKKAVHRAEELADINGTVKNWLAEMLA